MEEICLDWGAYELEQYSDSDLLKGREFIVNDSKRYLIIKRLIDIIGFTIGLIRLFPIMIIVAILIKLEDPRGPIFFTQVRCGKHPSKFKMYKFRSMYTDAEEKMQEIMYLNEQTGPVSK